MRNVILAAAVLATACGGSEGGELEGRPGDAPSLAGVVARDSVDSVLLAPRLVRERSVIVFWLLAADTFSAEDQAAVLDELTVYTDRIAPLLARHGIALVPTNADTVYVGMPNSGRRAVLLSGLEFPFGYVMIDPETGERILSGVFPDDELREELRLYFAIPESDSVAQGPRVTT